MKKIIKYLRWNDSYKEQASIITTLRQLDKHNRTSFSRKKNIDESLLEESSRYAHANQLMYFVTIYNNEKPYCFLELNKGFIRANFLDNFQRKYISYTFMGEDNIFEWRKNYGNKLFLETIVFWEFEGTTDKVIKISDHIFKPDGSFHVTERDRIIDTQIDSEAKTKIDVSANWEEYPEFGKYDSLIRKER